MKKIIFLFLLFLMGAFSSKAQTDTTDVDFPPMGYTQEYLDALADTCRAPVVVAKSVVTYAAGYGRLFARIEGLGLGQMVYYRNLTDQSATAAPMFFNSDGAIANNLPLNKNFSISTVNNCGQMVVIAYFDTRSAQTDRIEVSAELYDAIVSFQNRGTSAGSLRAYLQNLTQVPFYERAAFLQQYYYNGSPLLNDSGTQLPNVPPPTDGGEGDACRCKFVFNSSRLAIPATLNGDGTISPDIKKDEKKYTSYGKWWWVRQSRGPAKWHCIWNEGSKAGAEDRWWELKMTDINQNYSPLRASLRYNLFCTNYVDVPSECGCRKPLTIYWDYDTEVAAYAERHTEGWGQKKAVAAAQDHAVIVYNRDGSNSVEVWDAGEAKADAECQKVVNSDFWVKIVDVAKNIALFFVQQGDPNYVPLVNNLATSIQSVIGTPYYAHQNCQLEAVALGTLLHGNKQVFLEPNQPITVTMSSFTNIGAGGRRSFHSWARVNSNFYMAGYVPGGLFANESQNHCCTDRIGDWILASDGPVTVPELKNEVGQIFSAFAPWPYPVDPLSGIVQLPTEYGWMSYVADPNCKMPINGQTGGHGLMGDSDNRNEVSSTEPVKFKVFDISGRLVYEGQEQEIGGDLRQLLSRLGVTQAGIYVVVAENNARHEVHKVIMQ